MHCDRILSKNRQASSKLYHPHCSDTSSDYAQHHNRRRARSDAQKHNCVICIFSAPWCGPCKNLKLGLNDFIEQEKDIGWVMVDVDEAETMSAEHKIKQIPHVKFYVAKKKHCDLSGPCAQDVIATAQNILRM